jgi:hypothetical protein
MLSFKFRSTARPVGQTDVKPKAGSLLSGMLTTPLIYQPPSGSDSVQSCDGAHKNKIQRFILVQESTTGK